MSSADYIRTYYNVPAKRGGRVTFDGQPGRITGFTDQYLRVRLDGTKRSVLVHPTWRMHYL